MMPLNFPTYQFRTKQDNNRMLIFDDIRKKYVTLTPEEWVRQHLIHYLIAEKSYPITLISVETPLIYDKMDKRSDVLIHDRNGLPLMLVECKAPKVTITQKVFEQISIYNKTIQAPCLMITNGIQHYCYTITAEKSTACFLQEIPDYNDLMKMR